MSEWEKAFSKWDSFPQLDQPLRDELNVLKENKEQLVDAFYQELSFGTAGIRGVLGPGTNRMNIYTIRKVVYGLGEYLLENRVNVKDRGVVIAYDPRYQSKTFAVETAKVLATFGIKTHVFDKLHPTPLLSYAVRFLGTAAGVMITASHNPSIYNGFKVYNEDGGQIVPDEAEKIVDYINKVENELNVPVMDQDEMEQLGLLTWVGNEIDAAYLQNVKQISRLNEQDFKAEKDLPIVFTPLHGTSHDLILQGLEQLNFKNVHVVEEQAMPDPEFSTVTLPNPEEHQAFTMAIAKGKQVNANILIGTDPDSDRIGVAVKNDVDDYTVLTGNQFGVLAVHYLLTHSPKTLLQNARVLKTIVSTELARVIAEDFGVQTINTLTGFKYIGEKIQKFGETGETFLFGFEESYGCLVSDFVRDKDAVQAAMIASEMAYVYDKQGKTLLDVLNEIYEQYGYFTEETSSVTLKGKDGSDKINTIMENVRNHPFTAIAGTKVLQTEDYTTGIRTFTDDEHTEAIDLPKANVVKYILENDSWVCFRPSGTEPKIKFYYGVCESTRENSLEKIAAFKDEVESTLLG